MIEIVTLGVLAGAVFLVRHEPDRPLLPAWVREAGMALAGWPGEVVWLWTLAREERCWWMWPAAPLVALVRAYSLVAWPWHPTPERFVCDGCSQPAPWPAPFVHVVEDRGHVVELRGYCMPCGLARERERETPAA